MAGSGGVKLGNRIAMIVSQAMVATHAKLVHLKHRLAMRVFSDISDIISEEVHLSIGPILRKLHDESAEGGLSKPLTHFMSTEHGQLQAMAGTIAGASGIFSSVAQIVNNELSPGVRSALYDNPHLIPDPGTIANLAAHGLAAYDDAIDNIAENGINPGWGKALIADAATYPDMATALDLVRRGFINDATFHEWSNRNGVQSDASAKLLKLAKVPLSPPDAALATLRGNMTMEQALSVAAEWGVDADDFKVIIDNTGEPPGPEQLLEANRRGFIDKARLVRGILQSRIRNEWVDVIESLAFTPMSTSDAVNAVIQNHLTQDQGEKIASQNGLENGAFSTLVETAGAPLSRTEMEQLYNRGLVTEAQVNQALNESRLKPKYNKLAFELHTRLLDPSALGEMVVWGVMTHADAVAETVKLGYDEVSAGRIVSAAVNRKLQTDRQAVVSSIEVLYEDNAMSQEAATAAIAKLGFEPAEITFKLQAAEFKRHAKLINAGMTAIRAKFIGHHIDRAGASSLLDGMGIPHQQRDSLLQLWQIEHDANVTQLTEAQILKALKLELISADDATTRLINRGYSSVDAVLLIEGA